MACIQFVNGSEEGRKDLKEMCVGGRALGRLGGKKKMEEKKSARKKN